jgi:hypothetical protein
MSPVWKGAIVGAFNVYAVTLVVAVMQAMFESGEHLLVFAIGALGLGPGLAVGAIAGMLGGRLPVLRRLALCGLAMTGVILLGLYAAPVLIWIATPSTLIGALVLETWTRVDVVRRVPGPPSPLWMGAWIGAINALAIAVVFRLEVSLEHAPYMVDRFGAGGFAFFVGCLGLLPGLALGAAVGKFAGTLTKQGPVMRAMLIGTLAIGGMVTTLGVALVPFDIDLVSRGLLLPAVVPTVLCTLLLEHLTRPGEPVPRARAIG